MNETMQAALLDAAAAATGSGVHLLQSRARQFPGPSIDITEYRSVVIKQGQALMAAASPELQKTLPVGWLHVPKSGTSFINTLVHLPGVCPGVPEGLTISAQTFPHSSWGWAGEFDNVFDVPASCPGLLNHEWAHKGLKSQQNYEHLLGNYMMMIRQPEQRLISAYHDIEFSVIYEVSGELLKPERSWGGLMNKTIPTLSEYAASAAQGCVTKMMVRTEMFPCGAPSGYPTWQEVEEAKRMLKEDFSFIGLTEDWALSMCLLSAMFKVPCHAAQMQDTRLSRANSSHLYSTAELLGKDPYDGALYDEALRIFNARVEEHGVTEAWCRETCWRDAGLI